MVRSFLSSQILDTNNHFIITGREIDLEMRSELEKLEKEKERVEAERAALRLLEADNWLERSRRANSRQQDDQRRQNRFVL